MGLVLRLVTGSALSYAQMDDNLIYLDNKVTGSTGYITYFSGSDPTSSVVGQSLLFQTGSKMLMTGSFGVLGAISASFFVGDGSQLTNIPGSNPFPYNGNVLITGSVDVVNSANPTSRFQINPSIRQYIFSDGNDTLNQLQIALSGSIFNTTSQVLVSAGNKGLNLNSRLKVFSTETQITGSLTTTQAITANGDLNANGTTVGFNVSPNSKYLSFTDANDPFGNLVTLYLSGSGIVSVPRPYMQLGTKGLNIGNKINIISDGVQITGSLSVTQDITSAQNITAASTLSGSYLALTRPQSSFNVDTQFRELTYIDNLDPSNQFSIYLSGSNDNKEVLLQTGTKGLNVNDTFKILSTETQITGSLKVTGSISNNTTVTTTALITPQTVTEDITIPNNYNGMLIGPVNLNSNVTVEGNATLVII